MSYNQIIRLFFYEDHYQVSNRIVFIGHETGGGGAPEHGSPSLFEIQENVPFFSLGVCFDAK